MVDERLLQYVAQRVKEGYTEAQITAALRQQGQSESAIAAALKQSTHRAASKIPLIVIALLALGLLSFFLFRPEPSAAPVLPTPAPPPPPSGGAVELAAELQEQAGSMSADELYHLTVATALESAATPGDAILLCSVNQAAYKQYCLQELAKRQGSAAYCDIIGELDQRDECYLTLVLNGEDQYCAQLLLEENQQVCELLVGEL